MWQIFARKWKVILDQTVLVFIYKYPITSEGKKVNAFWVHEPASPLTAHTTTRWAIANSTLTITIDM